MKKLLFLAFLFVAAVGVKADDMVTARIVGTTLNIALQNATTYCAFQMDINLPEGVSATTVAAVANRLSQTGSDTEVGGTKFIVAHNTLEGNVLRVIAYNLANAEITDAKGNILDVTLDAEVADPTLVTVSNILLVSQASLAEVELADATAVKTADVNNDTKINIYDVAGVITIMNGGDASAFNCVAADANGDGNINIYDVATILQLMK